MNFGIFQLATYIKFYALSGIFTTFFLGGWYGPGILPPEVWFILKTFVVMLAMMLPRAVLPRVRIDVLLQGRVDQAHAPRLPQPLHRAAGRLSRALPHRRRLSTMGTLSSIKGAWIATWSGIRHAFKPRMTLRYPDQKLDLQGTGYHFDPKNGVGLPGFKGRHLLSEDKCTGCQLCAIACDGVAVAIEMQTMVRNKPQNKKNFWPAVDYGRCVFCALCVDYLTEVQTNPGLKQINQIEVGDLLLTHRGDYKPVTKVWDMSYTGAFYRIYVYGKPDPLGCTADHPIMAVSRPISKRKDKRLLRVTSPLLFHKPGDLKAGDYLVSPIVRKIVSTPKYEKDVQMYRGGKTTRRLSLDASPALFRLIGYYFAEGSCNGGRTVNFDFNENERRPMPKIAATSL